MSPAAISAASVSDAGARVVDAENLALPVFRLVRLKAKSPPALATWFQWRTKPRRRPPRAPPGRIPENRVRFGRSLPDGPRPEVPERRPGAARRVAPTP